MADNQALAQVQIQNLLRTGDSGEELESLLESMKSGDLLNAVFHLTVDEQRALLSIISAERAADLIEEMPGSHAADLIEYMPASKVVPIVGEMASDFRVDVLAEMDKEDSDAILEQLEEEDALEIRELSAFSSDVAGGLMMTEFMSYPMSATVREVLEDLTSKEGDYGFLTVHYIYVVVRKLKLKGVIRIRDLVFSDPEIKIGTITKPALTVPTNADLRQLEEFFDEHDIAAVPVVDQASNLLGIVRRRAVLEALTD
ncbi:MAG: magnesium transporter, partial [Woeseiaceae bacterium]|nr:magnesium transporter [Woeseiaceae bacterium]